MRVARGLYRAKQFFEAVFAKPTSADLELVRQILTPQQVALFDQLQPSEQAHAVRVLRAVQANCHQQGFEPPHDLLVAALLHDVGKARYPLWLWERVMIVLGKAILPEAANRWAISDKQATTAPRGWKRPFVIAAQHPAWGADMASEQGTTPRAVALIRRHQDQPPKEDTKSPTEEDPLLAILQAVDDES